MTKGTVDELLREERTLIMGILNVTPDSFSDGGEFLSPQLAVDRAFQMVEEGADILDIGGESSRPGAEPIPAAQEMERLLPVIEELAPVISVPISVERLDELMIRRSLHGSQSSSEFDSKVDRVNNKRSRTMIGKYCRITNGQDSRLS